VSNEVTVSMDPNHDPTKPYTPGWTGEVFILSPDSLSSSPLTTFGGHSIL
jgi:hypothetical protein